ncbi:hypothetical protein GU336_02125 [Lactococcus raffinolactis]|jgi:hypothetical protein|uniref:Uncharacterized protein n=1 Tax=Pseudolactococcus raffinolactis TaxID=1366 RepID=A0A6H0UFA2_9LACT|nr:hypothetical protein [Lactococcus raffinolactis]QIW53045.1 hypothetical protein GU336_02125 [Lactococcus raffinolactis]
MKHMKMIVGALSIVVLLMVSILVYNRLNDHSNVVIPKSSQVKQTSTFKTSTKKSSEDILDKSDQTESSEPAKSDSFAADQHVTGQEIKLARQDLKRAGIDADKLSDEEISVYIEQAKVEGRSIVEVAKSFGNISD